LEDNESVPASVALTGVGVPANAGPTGLQGSTGPQGSAGAQGPQGPQGPTGAQGTAGKNGQIRLVTCTVTTRHHKKRKTCTTRTITGTATFTTSVAHATLTRNGIIYATGTATRTRLTLDATRRVPAARYTLTLTHRVGHRKVVTRRLSVRIR
jgi:collagen triple helix repeat protein